MTGCGEPEKFCSHVDNAPKDHICDVFKEKLSEHEDANKDHKCDMCGATLSSCKDDDADGKCDICNTIMNLNIGFKSESYIINDSNKLVKNIDNENLYTITFKANIKEEVKVFSNGQAMNKFNLVSESSTNAFTHSLVKVINDKLFFNATGTYKVTIDFSKEGNNVFVDYSTENGVSQIDNYFAVESVDWATETVSLPYIATSGNPTVLTYKATNVNISTNENIQIKDCNKNLRCFTLSSSTVTSYWELKTQDEQNYTYVHFAKDAKHNSHVFDITFLVNVSDLSITLELTFSN